MRGRGWASIGPCRSREKAGCKPHLTPRSIGSGRNTADLRLNLPEAVPFVVGVHVDQSLLEGGGGTACLDAKDAFARVADLVLVVGRQRRDAGDTALGIRPRAGDDVVGEVAVGHPLGGGVLRG